MQTCIVAACAALTAVAGYATPDAAAGAGATNAPPPCVAHTVAEPGGAVAPRQPESVATNLTPVKVVYPDVPEEDFSVDDWAEELAEKAEHGLHVRNGQILVVVRMPAVEGEHQMLAKVRAKFRAIEFLRHHYPDMPKDFTATCRIPVCEMSDSGEECVVVMSFSEKDIGKVFLSDCGGECPLRDVNQKSKKAER